MACVQPVDIEIGNSEAPVGIMWNKWLLRLENYVSAIAVIEEGQKKAMLLQAVGVNT